MAKYLIQNAGKLQEVIPLTVSAGAADASKIIQTDAAGRIDASLMPVGLGPLVKNIVAGEALAAGDFVNIYNDGGTPTVRKADASDPTKQADGYVLSAFASAATALVYFEDFNTQVSGLTPGATIFLDGATPGGVTETAPTTSGYIVQILGKAITATEMSVEVGQTIQLA